jgi:hypothetical protein
MQNHPSISLIKVREMTVDLLPTDEKMAISFHDLWIHFASHKMEEWSRTHWI